MGFRWLPVVLTSKYLNLEILLLLLCYLLPISCHSNSYLMSVPRCGSIIVDLALKFKSTTKEQDVIRTLYGALEDGKLGGFSVVAIKGKRPDMKTTSKGTPTPTVGSSGGKSSKQFL